jgi:hypothetical protein
MVGSNVGEIWVGPSKSNIYLKKNPGKEAILIASSLGLFVGQADCSALKASTQVYSTELHPSVHFFLCFDHSRQQSPSGFYPF